MNYDPNKYDRPSVTADVLVFTVQDGALKVLMAKREKEPFQGRWALPGGFVGMTETSDETAVRKLREKAGVRNLYMEQLYTFTKIDRDPRMRIISIAYIAMVPATQLLELAENAALLTIKSDSVCQDGRSIDDEIAFDHVEIIRMGLERMRGKLDYADLAFRFLPQPEDFTMNELRSIYEAIIGEKVDCSNFRRDIRKKHLTGGRIAELSKRIQSVGRPEITYKVVDDDLAHGKELY